MTNLLLAQFSPPDWNVVAIIAGIVCVLAFAALLMVAGRVRRELGERDDWITAAAPPLRCPRCETPISFFASFATISPLSITCGSCRAACKIRVPGFVGIALVVALVAFGACFVYFWAKHELGQIAALALAIAVAAGAQGLGYAYYSRHATLHTTPGNDEET